MIARRPRAVVLTARWPWPPYTGERLRTIHWLDALADDFDVTLVSPPGAGAPGNLRIIPLRRRIGFRAGARIVRSSLPAHYIFSGSLDWADAESTLAEADTDLSVTLLTRVSAWIDPHRIGRTSILDAVDSLSDNMSERARSGNIFLRPLWQLERFLTARHQRLAASHYDLVTVTSETEADSFGRRVEVLPVGMQIEPLEQKGARHFDFGFWGRLGYFANRAAAELIVGSIWPRIRALRPEATLLLGGADAPRSIRRLDGSDGVRVISPMKDRSATLRQVKVALLPVMYGSGQSTKVLEAAEAGCAMIGFERAFRGHETLPSNAAVRVTDLDTFATTAARLVGDDQLRWTMATAARTWAEDNCDLDQNRSTMLRIAREVAGV